MRRFSTRLLAAFLLLIVLTTLSTSLPAYWLARRQLQAQAWRNVANAQQATHSLLEAEQMRLAGLAQLFAERPTLQQLVRSNALTELAPYLRDFQTQSDLDILVFCQDGRLLAGDVAFTAVCSTPPPGNFSLVNGQPAMLAHQPVTDALSQKPLGVTITGRWLDTAALSQLAANTGVGHTILSPTGRRFSSSLPGAGEPTFAAAGGADLSPLAALSTPQTQMTLDGNRYFVAYLPLPGTAEIVLLAEVALPVNDLIVTERQGMLALAVSTAVVVLLAGLLGSWYVRQLVSPLQKLTAAAEQISQGDLLAPIPLITVPAEINTLAAALQQSQEMMLHSLEEQSQAREWLNTLIQSIAEGVVTLDGYGRITFFSQGAEALTGWTATEAIGVMANEVFRLAAPESRRFLEVAPPAGSKRQIVIRTRQGKNSVLAVTGARLHPLQQDPAQPAARVALVLRDVTQEEALRRLRSYFLANISHEFRTPLSTLQASMELLLDEEESLSAAEMRELLKPSYLSLSSLQTLIDNLLESSSIEAGEFAIKLRPCTLHDCIRDALHIVRPLLERRRQAIAFDEPAHLPEIQADPARLTQVVVNLLTNASKYSPPGATITVELAGIDGRVRLAVSDEGPGIPPAERANLFHRFVRLDSADREQYGIGLGLYVVKTVIEAHHGRVGVADRPEGGSTFWVELPVMMQT
ncbi:MAG: HAMP domain-containing protein [Anaerolineae bacterium]|nr:HAMP domain-containing protein [Anaerolineae bacterium]